MKIEIVKTRNEMALFYCPECDEDTGGRIDYREETTRVKGEEISFRVPVRVCDVCENTIYDEEIDPVAQQRAFDVYRQRHDIITPRRSFSLGRLTA
jgi:hypothetical protein